MAKNNLAVINTARRYAKSIAAKKYPNLEGDALKAKIAELAAQPRLRALARINLSRKAA